MLHFVVFTLISVCFGFFPTHKGLVTQYSLHWRKVKKQLKLQVKTVLYRLVILEGHFSEFLVLFALILGLNPSGMIFFFLFEVQETKFSLEDYQNKMYKMCSLSSL